MKLVCATLTKQSCEKQLIISLGPSSNNVHFLQNENMYRTKKKNTISINKSNTLYTFQNNFKGGSASFYGATANK